MVNTGVEWGARSNSESCFSEGWTEKTGLSQTQRTNVKWSDEQPQKGRAVPVQFVVDSALRVAQQSVQEREKTTRRDEAWWLRLLLVIGGGGGERGGKEDLGSMRF
jgi:hypothetical protein